MKFATSTQRLCAWHYLECSEVNDELVSTCAIHTTEEDGVVALQGGKTEGGGMMGVWGGRNKGVETTANK